MEELYQRMAAMDAEHKVINISIAELQRQRTEDRKLMIQFGEELKNVSKDIRAVKEIVIAWNNIKGFVETMKAINATMYFALRVIAWVVGIGAAIMVLIKTGNWPGHGGPNP